jgi:hypothetical protein
VLVRQAWAELGVALDETITWAQALRDGQDAEPPGPEPFESHGEAPAGGDLAREEPRRAPSASPTPPAAQ